MGVFCLMGSVSESSRRLQSLIWRTAMSSMSWLSRWVVGEVSMWRFQHGGFYVVEVGIKLNIGQSVSGIVRGGWKRSGDVSFGPGFVKTNTTFVRVMDW